MGRLMSRVVCGILRAAEVICGGVVLAITTPSIYKQRTQPVNAFSIRYLLSVIVSVVSVLTALLLLPPLEVFFRYFLVDLVLSITWFAAFALLILEFSHMDCEQGLRAVGSIALGGDCNTFRAAWCFAFLSGCVWLGTFVVGLWVVMRESNLKRKSVQTTITRG